MIKTAEVTQNHKSQKTLRKWVRNLIPGTADGRLSSLAISEERMTSTRPRAGTRDDHFHWWSAHLLVSHLRIVRLIYQRLRNLVHPDA